MQLAISICYASSFVPSSQMIMNAARNMVQAEWSMENTMKALTRMEQLRTNIDHQYQTILDGAEKIPIVEEQVQFISRLNCVADSSNNG